MGFLFRFKKEENKANNNIILLLQKAKEGDMDARNRLIDMYTPFILKVASKVSGRYIRVGEDDEVSIGMMAFNEAVNSFNDEKNTFFLSFAETVIKRRLIDYYRKEQKNKNYIPFSSFDNDTDEKSEKNSIKYIEAEKSLAEYEMKNESIERREEIILYSNMLKEYGISFSELVELSPKHEDARLRAMEVAKLIAEDENLTQHLLTKKALPLKHILPFTDLSRKTLERQRKYIIAIVLILINDFEHLKSYIAKIL